jgi:hypothetical protein
MSKNFRRLFEVVLAASLVILVAFTLLLVLMPVSTALASLGPAGKVFVVTTLVDNFEFAE